MLIYFYFDYNNRFTTQFKDWADQDRWVVKGPFSTNKQGRYFAKSSTDIIEKVRFFFNRECCRINEDGSSVAPLIPYVMVQPRIKNPHEKKVACFNGIARYIAANACKIGKSFDSNNPQKTIEFAQTALNCAKTRLGNRLITEGLFRIDIFQVSSDPERYVVNEFESLDADVYGTAQDRNNNEGSIRQDLINYWGDIIQKELPSIIQEYFSTTTYLEEKKLEGK